MKIFLLSLTRKNHFTIARELLRRGIEISYISGSGSHFKNMEKDTKTFSKTLFHNTLDAISAVPAPHVDTTDFFPIGKELAHKLLECENQVLTMMNGLDFSSIPLIKKKHYYYEYVKYWYNILLQHKPDVVVFVDIPHVPHNFVIYSLCKILGIRTLMYRSLLIPGRLLFMENFQEYKRIVDVLKIREHKNFSLSDLKEDMQEFYKKQTNPNVDVTPFYMKKEFVDVTPRVSSFLPSMSSIVKHILNFTFFRTTYFYIKMMFKKRRLPELDGFNHSGLYLKWKLRQWKSMREKYKNEYYSLQQEVDFSKKFVYVPLHNQPECTTSSLGGIFVDQLLMIDILSRALPPGWVIYVKETPMQWKVPRTQFGRYEGYYKKISEMKNVILIPTETSTYDLIHHCQAVATVTGTAGFEGVLRSKPALIFGSVWYMYSDGVFRVSDYETASSAFHTILSGYKPDQQKVINFLKTIDDLSILGFANKRYKVNSALTNEENTLNILETLYSELLGTVHYIH